MCESISLIVEFTSVAKEFRHEYVVEKSRFITTVYPCSTEEEAQTFINRINKEFWDARHNCTAFALGPKQEQQRSSDNGEPSGTAGVHHCRKTVVALALDLMQRLCNYGGHPKILC